MLAQCGIQYGLDWSCLRAPWIMEKDDFRYTLSFGDDIFGGPDWKTLVPPEIAARARAIGAVPLLLDADGAPLRRNFVHVDDLVSAILIALTTRPRASSSSTSPWTSPSTTARSPPISPRPGASPRSTSRAATTRPGSTTARPGSSSAGAPTTTCARLIEAAWAIRAPPDDPRRVWYPG